MAQTSVGKGTPPPTRRQQVATSYFEAALEILEEEGYGGLKLAPVCQRLGVTTGAFYHNFTSWADFTRQLLDHWHTERTTRLIELVRAEPDPLLRLQQLLETATSLPHGAEAAIRVWSTIDPDVQRIQAAVDSERIDVVRSTFAALVPPAEADHYARTALFLLVGHDMAGPNGSDKTLAWALRLLINVGAREH